MVITSGRSQNSTSSHRALHAPVIEWPDGAFEKIRGTGDSDVPENCPGQMMDGSKLTNLVRTLYEVHGDDIEAAAGAMKPCEYYATQHYGGFVRRSC